VKSATHETKQKQSATEQDKQKPKDRCTSISWAKRRENITNFDPTQTTTFQKTDDKRRRWRIKRDEVTAAGKGYAAIDPTKTKKQTERDEPKIKLICKPNRPKSHNQNGDTTI